MSIIKQNEKIDLENTKEIFRHNIDLEEVSTKKHYEIGFKILKKNNNFIAWVARGFEGPRGFFVIAQTISEIVKQVSDELKERGYEILTDMETILKEVGNA